MSSKFQQIDETEKLIKSIPLNQPKFSQENSKNFYDQNWNFDRLDPWLGISVSHGYVPFS